jgi:hypothetical protein
MNGLMAIEMVNGQVKETTFYHHLQGIGGNRLPTGSKQKR